MKTWKVLYDSIELREAYVSAETPQEAKEKWENDDGNFASKPLDYFPASFVEVQNEDGEVVLEEGSTD